MLHKVLKQRRRFAFALLLTQLAFYDVWPQTAIFGVMVVLTLCGVVLVAASGHPRRRLVECGAIGLLCCTRMPDMTTTVVVFLGATATAYVLLYSHLLDHIPLRIGMRSRKLFLAPYDLRTTWSKVLPGQGHPAAFWTGTMHSLQRDELDPATIYIQFREGDGPAEDVTVTYLHLVPRREATYLLERDTLLTGEEILITYHFSVDNPEQTRIQSDMRVSGLPVRHAVERFFDDVLGDELDSFATMTDCKRTWHVRDVGDVALTSELGRDSVVLDVKIETTDVADTPVALLRKRMSA